MSGAGHGQSGVAASVYLAGKRLGREKLIAAANAGFDFERSIYSAKLKAWPDRRGSQSSRDFITGYCSGAPLRRCTPLIGAPCTYSPRVQPFRGAPCWKR